MKIRQILAGLALIGMTLSVSANERWFPADAKRGIASFESYPEVIIIDGKKRMASPGLRIWDKDNAIEIEMSRKIKKVAINYTEGEYNLIERIWILTPKEASQPLKTMAREEAIR